VSGNINKSRARGLAFVLLAAILGTACLFVTTGQASARCNGAGNRVTSDFWVGGYKRAAEYPDPGTCNNNGLYQSVLNDEREDGRAVYVFFSWTTNPNNWYQAAATGTAVHFEYRNPNREAWQQFCINNSWTCGWGTNPSGSGLNHGF
jgi:hypothetical protein